MKFFRRPCDGLAVELKVGDFNAAYKGQREFYLRWLDKFEREAGKEPPLGIILCAGKQCEPIELLEPPPIMSQDAGQNGRSMTTAIPGAGTQ